MHVEKTAYIVEVAKGWEEEFKNHTVLDWMHDFEKEFDFGNLKSSGHELFLTDDFSFTKPNGETISGFAAAWKALLELYAPFTGHYHEPKYCVAYETDNGYTMTGIADLFANFPVPGERTKVDLTGRAWDLSAPGSFQFEYVKDPTGHKGLKMKSQKLYTDGLLLVAAMVKRGMVTADQALATLGYL